jgi:transposase InsO family protein
MQAARFMAAISNTAPISVPVLVGNPIRLVSEVESGDALPMIDVCRLIWLALVGLLQSRVSLEVEILALRHQLNVLRRKSPKKLTFTIIDRLVFAGLYRLAPGMLDALAIVEPQTVIRWHRAGFRAYWRWKSKPRGGRPKTPLEIRHLIRDMSLANPLWGAPRIHGELLKLGIDVGQTSVAKYMAKHRRPPSQGWKTFLRNHADGVASIDLFVVPTISFRVLYGLLILRHGRRHMLWLGVTANPTAEWIARQLTEACGWEPAPKYIVRDRDRVYGEVFTRRLRAMGIRDRPTAPRSPWQNGHTERLIGSIRRECLDHVVVFGERHLRHVLLSYMQYYNGVRTHLSLNKDAPVSRAVQAIGRILPMPILGGLHHQYVRV